MTETSLFARWRDRQLSRLESVFVAIVILVLLSIFLDQVFIIMARAERTLVENSILNINTTLRMYKLQNVLENNPEQINAMQHANPVHLLEQLGKLDIPEVMRSSQLAAMLKARSSVGLQNYAGELSEAAASTLEPGSWYFDIENKALIYIIRSKQVFRSELPGRVRLRYQLKLDYTDENKDGLYSPDFDHFNSIGLQTMDDNYKWMF